MEALPEKPEGIPKRCGAVLFDVQSGEASTVKQGPSTSGELAGVAAD
jgi:hypothetical protein